jgi:heme-degrading monooxygenase HmoA
MASVYVRLKVADFNAWKKVFDEVEPLRKKFGSTGADVFCNNSNKNELILVTYWATKEEGIKYFQSQELKEVQARAGVLNAPDVIARE